MAAQVEVQTGEVGRPVAGGRLHLSPLTDSSNKTVETPQITQSHIITPEPSKPAPGPKPRLTPKPFAVEKNPTIKPILAPKPQPKPRPESTRPAGSRPEFPGSSKPQQPVPTGKPKLVSTNPNRPAPTTFKTSNNLNTGQTIKPTVQPFKPLIVFDAEEPSKPTPPVPAIRKNTGPRSLAYSKSLKKFPVAEWPRTTKREDEKGRGTSNGGAPMTRAKSMGSLNQVGQEEEEEKEKAVASVPLRPQTRTSRPRPVSALFLDNPSKTETPVPAPRWGGRRPLSADLTSKFESIGLSLHRKSPKANTKDDVPEEETLSETKTCPDDASNSFTPADQSDINTGKKMVKDTDENKHGGSIKSRISLLLDSSSCPSAGAAGQGSDLNSPVQVVPEPEPPVGVKQLIKQLTEDVLPTPSPIMKPALKPRPLPLDLTKRFSTERSPDLGSTSLSEAIDRHEISKDPQWMTEASPVSHSDQWIMDLTDSREQLKWASTPESMRTFTPEESGPAAELQTVRASLFENVVERHSVLVVDDAKPAKKDFLSSSSFKRKSSEDDGTLLTATYKEPVAPSSPLCVVHAFDSVQAVVSEAVSENIPAAQWEDKAMTLRSRRSEGSRNEMTASGYRDPALAATPEPHPRYLRVGALHKWTTTSFDTHAGMRKETLQEENLDKDRDKPKEAEKEEVLGETKRLKRHTEEQPKPKATYFALTAQIQDNVSPVDSGATKGGGISPFDPMSSLLGSSQGKILSVRRNPSLDEALGKTFASQDQVEESVMRSRMSHKEIRSPSDGETAEEMMEVEKNMEAKMKELEREKPRQPVLEQQAQFAKMKEIEMQREFVRQRQKERIEAEERERERQKEREKARKQEKERQRQREEERQRELDRQNHLLELQREKQKREELELERQQLLEFEKQKQKEKERQQAMELEQQVQRELERQRQRDLERERQRQLNIERQELENLRLRQEELEKERQRKELERQLESEKQKQKEKERQQAMELEQQVQREKLEREKAEKLKQAALEQEMLRLREIEKEKERQMEMEKERQKELEQERQRELERQRQKDLERERQRQLDIERQELENQRLRQEELEKERQRKEFERQQRLEFEKQKQKEKERQQAMELEQREREKLEREKAEKLKQAALEQEMLRLREIEKEKERQMEKERQKELEQERQRQKALERDRQRQLDIERQALENQRLRQEELEKERQRKELEAMERRRLLEFEKQRQAEELERRLREEAEKMRQVAKQQEAERRRMREKQERRSESSPLRPKVTDPDAPLRNEPQAAPQRSDPSTRWKEPSPRADEPYKPSILDIDSFPSQTQLPPSKDLVALSNVQSVDSGLGSKSQHTPERDVSWKVPPPTSGGFSSPIWTSPQDPWQLWSNELSVDRPTAEPRKPASRVGPEQLLLRQEERQPTPQRQRPAVPDELLLFDPFCPTKTASPPPAGASSSLAAEMIWLPKEPQRQDSRAEVPKPRRSQGSQDSRMRSRSMCRRSAPSTSASEGNLPRIRSRSAHREQERHSWVQEKQSDKDEKERKGSETPVHDTDSQYGTWETGLRTDDSLTPATPTSDSNLSPSPRKPTPSHTPGERGSQSETDTLDGLLPSPANQPLSFPDAPSTLLDNSVLRTRAQLAKKRAPRTRPSRAARQSAALAGEGGSGDDWLYRDSTEAKVEGKNDDSDSEEQNKDADVGAAVAPQPQRVALFPGVDPSALKAQLRKRGDSDTQTDGSTPSPSQPSRSPKSPFLPRAARVLPTPGGKENGEEDSPQWLKELKSKKRLSQYESES